MDPWIMHFRPATLVATSEPHLKTGPIHQVVGPHSARARINGSASGNSAREKWKVCFEGKLDESDQGRGLQLKRRQKEVCKKEESNF